MALAWFQSLDGNTTIQLDAVENLQRVRTGTPTTSRVEEGSRVTDHYEVEPETATFSGIISDIKLRDTNITPQPSEYVALIEERMLSGTPFVFHVSDIDIPNIRNALITSFTVAKNAQIGRGLRVNISLQAIDFASRAQVSTVQLASDFVDQGSSEVNGRSGTTKQVNGRGQTIGAQLLSEGKDLTQIIGNVVGG